MNLLITGSCGFVGSKLTKFILDNYFINVYGVDNLMWVQSKDALKVLQNYPNFHFIKTDVRDISLYRDVIDSADVIFPLAALVGYPLCDKHPKDAEEINSLAVKNLVARLSRHQRILYANSNSGYGIGGEAECTEESPLNPISIYGKTKCDGEKAILDHENSMSLRLATVFGVSHRMRFDLMVNNFIERLHDSETLEIYEPHFRRNFVGIDDVIRAFSRFGFWSDATGVYNLGNPELNMTKLQLAERLISILGLNRAILPANKNDPDKRDYVVSNAKILATGFKFKQNLENIAQAVYNIVSVTPKETRLTWRNY